MGMLGTGIHMEVAIELVAKTILRKHAADGVFENALGMAGKDLCGSGLALAARITGVALIYLVGHFLAGEDDLLSINDDNVVAAVDVRGEARFGLAAEDVGNAGGQASYGLILGINEHPFFLDGVLVGGDCFVT
jgi:hypothetical protein